MASRYEFDWTRPASWSYVSAYEWDKEAWFRKYILGIPEPETAELAFGKAFADSCETRRPLAPVTMMSRMEKEFSVRLNKKVTLRGFVDTFCEDTKRVIGEYKTGVKVWDQKRADLHGQITMYALMNLIENGVRPEECTFFLEWIPTTRVESGDFSVRIDFKRPVEVRKFYTKRTTAQVLSFGDYVLRTMRDMEEFVRNHA